MIDDEEHRQRNELCRTHEILLELVRKYEARRSLENVAHEAARTVRFELTMK